ncbi:MAG: arsenate reductase/protein-tyrosine-phosphatase family protein [Candidatus Geothermincolia bacterium]
MSLSFLFVCTGNICRSPMAEALFSDKLLNRFPHLFPFVNIASAGISAVAGSRATESSMQVMDLWGIDIEHHRATPLQERELAEADIVIVMAREHLLALERMNTELSQRAFTLKQLASLRQRVIREVGEKVPIDERELQSRFRRVMALAEAEGKAARGKRRDREPEFGDRAFDIMDPVGGNLEVYLMVAEELDAAVEGLMDMFFGTEKES